MELQHINVKLFLKGSSKVTLDAVIPVLHGWVQDQVYEELLIDVADYRHLNGGPGLILVGHESDYSFNLANQQLEICYNRKAALKGTNNDRFTQATLATLNAFNRLASDLKFSSHDNFNGTKLE